MRVGPRTPQMPPSARTQQRSRRPRRRQARRWLCLGLRPPHAQRPALRPPSVLARAPARASPSVGSREAPPSLRHVPLRGLPPLWTAVRGARQRWPPALACSAHGRPQLARLCAGCVPQRVRPIGSPAGITGPPGPVLTSEQRQEARVVLRGGGRGLVQGEGGAAPLQKAEAPRGRPGVLEVGRWPRGQGGAPPLLPGATADGEGS